jgi:hypothetical protein
MNGQYKILLLNTVEIHANFWWCRKENHHILQNQSSQGTCGIRCVLCVWHHRVVTCSAVLLVVTFSVKTAGLCILRFKLLRGSLQASITHNVSLLPTVPKCLTESYNLLRVVWEFSYLAVDNIYELVNGIHWELSTIHFNISLWEPSKSSFDKIWNRNNNSNSCICSCGMQLSNLMW